MAGCLLAGSSINTALPSRTRERTRPLDFLTFFLGLAPHHHPCHLHTHPSSGIPICAFLSHICLRTSSLIGHVSVPSDRASRILERSRFGPQTSKRRNPLRAPAVLYKELKGQRNIRQSALSAIVIRKRPCFFLFLFRAHLIITQSHETWYLWSLSTQDKIFKSAVTSDLGSCCL